MFGIMITERLQLKPLVQSDASQISSLLANDPETIEMTEDLPSPCTLEAAELWVRSKQKPGLNVFAIQLNQTGDLIGCVGIKQNGAVVHLEYWIGQKYQNNGYATEAAWAVVRNSKSLGITEVLSEVFTENKSSARVLQKLDFKHIGEITRNIPSRGGIRAMNQFQFYR